MIKSELDGFLNRRQKNLNELDKVQFPLGVVEDQSNWPELKTSLSKVLAKPNQHKIKVLAEVKKKSPSLGELSKVDAYSLCESFLSGGADAISVLVDNVNFGGYPMDLKISADRFPDIPFLYKDFVMESYQVYLARALGASNVLLMTQVLDDNELKQLYDLSLDIGLEPFVEVHNVEQLQRALQLKPKVIGINARDFSTKGLPVDLNNAGKLLHTYTEGQHWPEETFVIAQSGIDSEETYQKVISACPDGLPHAVQIGSSVSRSGSLPEWLFEKRNL